MIQYLSRDPAQYTPACGEPPGMETSNNIGVEEEQNPRSLLRSFDSCFESCFDSLFDICFDRSSAGARPIIPFVQHEETYYTPVAAAAAVVAADTATGANVVANALAQQTTPASVRQQQVW